MAKKRNCRRTPEEVDVHEQAVKLRKMTDAQLVEKFNSVAAETSKPVEINSIGDFLTAFENAGIAGIGKVTIKKLKTFAEENGYI